MIQSSNLRIQLLGGFQVTIDSRALPTSEWKRDSARKLIALLAINSGHKVSKSRVATFLQGKRDEKLVANALYSARSTLGAAARHIRSDRSALWLETSRDLLVDVDQFEETVVLAQLCNDEDEQRQLFESATALYRGELLPDYEDPQISSRREALQTRYADVLKQYCKLLANTADRGLANHTRKRLFLLDPTDSQVASSMMSALVDAGDSVEALEVYEQHRVALATVAGVAPNAEIQIWARQTRELAFATVPMLRAQNKEGCLDDPISGVSDDRPVAATQTSTADLGESYVRFAQTGNPLLGRSDDIDKVTELLALDNVRLLTLFGIGGVGKTALASEVASRWSKRNSAAGGSLKVLDARVIGNQETLRSLIARTPEVDISSDGRFKQRNPTRALHRSLLVVDNFELVLSQRATLSDLLSVSLDIKILVTSRVPLGLQDEYAYGLNPLSLDFASVIRPGLSDHDLDGVCALQPAIELFRRRAARVNPLFSIRSNDVVDLIEILRAVSGIPLAIEIAAARCRFMSVQALRSSLDAGVHVLHRAPKLPATREQNQRSMVTILEWTYNQLSAPTQRLLRLLSVFVAGFRPVSVADAMRDNVPNVFGSLDQLLEYNLVVVVASTTHEDTSDHRCTLLEPVRRFAFSELSKNEVELATAHARQADYCLRELKALANLVGNQPQLAAHFYVCDEPNFDRALSTLRKHSPSDFVGAVAYISTLTGPVLPAPSFVDHFREAACVVNEATSPQTSLLVHQAVLLSWFFLQPLRPSIDREIESVLRTCQLVEQLYFSLEHEERLSELSLGCLFRSLQARYFVQNGAIELLDGLMQTLMRLPKGFDQTRSGQRIRAICNDLSFEMTLCVTNNPSYPPNESDLSIAARRRIEMQLTDDLVHGRDARDAIVRMIARRHTPNTTLAKGENIIELMFFMIEAQAFEFWDQLQSELIELLGEKSAESSQRLNARQARMIVCELGQRGEQLAAVVGECTFEDWQSFGHREDYLTHCVRNAFHRFEKSNALELLDIIDAEILSVLSVHFASRLTETLGMYCARRGWVDIAKRLLVLADRVRRAFEMSLTPVELVVRMNLSHAYEASMASLQISELTPLPREMCFGRAFGILCRPLVRELRARIANSSKPQFLK
jgi:predicted ATPase/DNA-binding SARP family transcriptional activator